MRISDTGGNKGLKPILITLSHVLEYFWDMPETLKETTYLQFLLLKGIKDFMDLKPKYIFFNFRVTTSLPRWVRKTIAKLLRC